MKFGNKISHVVCGLARERESEGGEKVRKKVSMEREREKKETMKI